MAALFGINVRQADLADLNACCRLDPSYVTEYVWQMETRHGEGTVAVTFRTVRLPRPMKVGYPRDTTEMLESWRRGDPFFVAVDEEKGLVRGYLELTVQPWHDMGWISNLVVDKSWRRRGIGTLLLRAARKWAGQRELTGLTLEMQTKNYPAISFARKHNFSLCGYNDRYYSNYDIALFFVQNL
jgi:ribosomal protein S18 acetylase RimI-like enzyme